MNRAPELRIADQDLETLVREHLPSLRGYLASLGAHAEMVDDIAQDVFLAVIEQHEQYERDRPFRAWLFGIARNLVHQEYRKARTRCRLRAGLVQRLLLDQSEEDEAVLQITRSEAVQQLRRCLERLTERARAMLRFRFEQLLSGEEIAARLGLGHGTVRMGLMRARIALRTCVEGRGESP